MDTKTITPYQSIEMINNFLRIYNTTHKINSSLFNGIDLNEPSCTNDKMELFYEYMHMHNTLYKNNPNLTDIHIDEPINNMNKYDVYACINCDTKNIICKSLSYISLLLNGVKDENINTINWTIIKL